MKSCRRFLAFASGALLIFFFTALPVLAAEGAEPDPAESSTGLIFRWINFLIVFGGIAYLVAKHGGAFFRGNAKEIAASIVEATAVKAEADREFRVVETKIARLDQDVAEMREEARRNWAAESERLHASGQAEVEKIAHAAREELAASERAAQQQGGGRQGYREAHRGGHGHPGPQAAPPPPPGHGEDHGPIMPRAGS